MLWLLSVLVLAVAPGSAMAAKATQNVTYDTRSLATTLWYPDKLEVIRGVVVFTGGAASGMSGDTRGMVDNKFWQRFAESFGFAILGNQFVGSYTNAAMGTGKALLDSLAGLATATNHPELARVPLLLEGFSNGGYFSFAFAQFAPARVIAFCLNKSGYARAPMDAAFLAVPGLLIWGSEEPATNVPTVIHSLVQQGRMNHALWAELKEWGAQHEEGSAERVFAPFFAEMIAARYPIGASPLAADVPLIALDEAAGWLADHSDTSVNANLPLIARFADYKGDKQAASWLPSEALANLWRGFVTKTPITLSSPAAGAQFDANQSLQLTATGIAAGESASFLAGATPIAAAVSASGGQAMTKWSPSAGGVAGLLASAVNAGGTVTRTSRPVHVALYGKPAPQGSVPNDAGVSNPDAGVRDAGVGAAGAAGAAGLVGAVAGNGARAGGAAPAAGSGMPAAGSGTINSRDAAIPGDDSSGRSHGGCAVRGLGAANSGPGLAWFGLLVMIGSRRRLALRKLRSVESLIQPVACSDTTLRSRRCGPRTGRATDA
jgi:pimeloyl-ACP methyl ester carboxylesterase